MGKAKYKEYRTEEGLLKLEGWARDGLTDEQIADEIGIKRPTIYEWKKKYPDIADALKVGKEVVDRKVEKSLLKRAMGTTLKVTQYKMIKVEEAQLNAERMLWMHEYKMTHQEATDEELIKAKVQCMKEVSEFKKVPMIETETEIAPDTSAAIFWLKNRLPEKYRDQTFRKLNEAEARKAQAEAIIAEAQAELAGSTETAEDKLAKLLNIVKDNVTDDQPPKGDGPPDGNA